MLVLPFELQLCSYAIQYNQVSWTGHEVTRIRSRLQPPRVLPQMERHVVLHSLRHHFPSVLTLLTFLFYFFAPWAWIARNTLSGVRGICLMRIPKASATALATAGAIPSMGISAIAFAPKGPKGSLVSTMNVSITGMSGAL